MMPNPHRFIFSTLGNRLELLDIKFNDIITVTSLPLLRLQRTLLAEFEIDILGEIRDMIIDSRSADQL
jgi:hypothetical protein